MEKDPCASESDAISSDPSDPDPHSCPRREPMTARFSRVRPSHPRFSCTGFLIRLGPPGMAAFVVLSVFSFMLPDLAWADGLERVRKSGKLLYGSDMEGGGPYAYPDPKSPRDVTGFEVELMALLGQELATKPEFSQGQWDKLLQVLSSGRLDAVINGYEWTETAPASLRQPAPTTFTSSSSWFPGRARSGRGPTSSSRDPTGERGPSVFWSARREIPSRSSRAGRTSGWSGSTAPPTR